MPEAGIYIIYFFAHLENLSYNLNGMLNAEGKDALFD